MEITEKTGHGTVKIGSAYGKEAFDIQDGFIQVTIPFNKKVMKNRGTINGAINGTLKNDNLTNNELTLLGILLSNPSISLADVGDRRGISRRAASRIVASLHDKGIVERKESKAGELENRQIVSWMNPRCRKSRLALILLSSKKSSKGS